MIFFNTVKHNCLTGHVRTFGQGIAKWALTKSLSKKKLVNFFFSFNIITRYVRKNLVDLHLTAVILTNH